MMAYVNEGSAEYDLDLIAVKKDKDIVLIIYL